MDDTKVALVTGGAGGMGSATVARLTKDRFRVTAFDINAAGLEAIGPAIQPGGRTYRVDMTNEEEVRTAVAQVEEDMGPVHVLVNLIGWSADTSFAEEASAYWKKLIAINFESLLYVTHAVLPGMVQRQRGKVVNVASDAGKVGQSGEAVYSGCKGAVIAWSKSLARELARYNITVNCTSPGPTTTALNETVDPDLIKRVVRLIPFRRQATPEEQAAAIAFFCSGDADYITGQVLSVSGGLTMQ